MGRIFHPIGSKLVSATSSSAAVTMPGTVGGTQDLSLRLHNEGPSPVFVAFGGSGASAATDGTSMIIPVGNTETFAVQPGETHIATICASGETASLYATRDEGA